MSTSTNPQDFQQDDPIQEMTNNALDFAIKMNMLLYEGATQKRKNLLFSPISLFSGLAIFHLGMDGTSREEFAELLGFPSEENRVSQMHETLCQILTSIQKSKNFHKRQPKPIRRIANGMFVHKTIDLFHSYVSYVKTRYKGEIFQNDFRTDEKAIACMNRFMSKSTNDELPNLFTSPLRPETQIILITSMYFKASWEQPFSKASTIEESFITDSGSTVQTKMMTQQHYTPYVNLADLKLEAVNLNHENRETSTFYILPYSDQTLTDLVSSLNRTNLQRIVENTRSTYIDLKIPRMKCKWSNHLNTQSSAEIEDIFTVNANFNRMTGQVRLYSAKIIHAAEIEVDENGIEADTTNDIKWRYSGLFYDTEPEPIPFHVNKPFLFFIYHRDTRAILFLGAINNPIIQD